MNSLARRLSLAAVLMIPGAIAQAQPFQMAPGLNTAAPYNAAAMGFNPYANTGSFFNRVANSISSSGFNPYAAGASMSSITNPALASGGYNSPYYPYYNYPDPYSGNLRGSAEVINSMGQYMISTQQAKIMQEHVRREKIENRRRVLEEWLWERNNLPTLQDEFERAQKINLRRQQNDPPVTEILSAQALNVLLLDIQKNMGSEEKGPDIKLDEQMLKDINVTPVKNSANIGMLKKEKLTWPLALRHPDFKKERDLLDTLTPEAKEQVAKRGVDAATLNQLNNSVDALQQDLSSKIKDMPPSQYIEAKRFLNDYKDAIKAIGREDAANFFSGKYSARGRSVAELVRNMTKDGLTFAPSISGHEAAYVALHRMLAAYDLSISKSMVEQR